MHRANNAAATAGPRMAARRIRAVVQSSSLPCPSRLGWAAVGAVGAGGGVGVAF